MAEIIDSDEKRTPNEGENPRFNLEIVGENVSEAMTQLRDKVSYWADRGRYNKIRITRGGKPLLPDIPIAAVMAFEAATFFWTGPLRALVVNVVGRVFFEVELINEAEEHYKRGLEYFLAGDMQDAEKCLIKALRIDERFPRAHLQLGVLRKIQGRVSEAVDHFKSAVEFDQDGATGREAELHLEKIKETSLRLT